MKRNVLKAICVVGTLSACGGGGNVNLPLYPVEGQLNYCNPSEIIAVKLRNQTTASANISFVLPGSGKKNRCNRLGPLSSPASPKKNVACC